VDVSDRTVVAHLPAIAVSSRTAGETTARSSLRPSTSSGTGGIRRAALSVARALPRFTGFAVVLLAWQVGTSTGLLDAWSTPSPAAVARAFWTLATSGALAHHLLVSLVRVAGGLALGVSAGITLGLVAGLLRIGEVLVDAPLQSLRMLPHLALLPLFIVWFGIGETPKLGLIALGSFFPVYVNLFSGIRGVDVRLVEAVRTLGLSRLGLVVHVVLPGALPSVLTGLRLSLGVAWLSLVVAEQVNASAGIGFLISDAREFLRTDIIFVGLMVYAALGLASDLAVRLVERRALRWRPAFPVA
jgi:sulfonate transport system permease protein